MRKGWEIKNLEDITEVFEDGDWIESKDQSSNGIRLIQTGNVGNGIFKDRGEKARYISPNTFKRLRCTEIFSGDCLVSRLPDPVGRACLVPKVDERMITAVDCTIIRFKNFIVLPKWFVYYTLSKDYIIQIEKQITGATRQRISRKNLGLIEIPIPSLSEQKPIVEILDNAFAAIDKAKANIEKNLQNAKELFESYLQNVFVNKGEDWTEMKLGEISEVKDGTHDSPKYIKDGIPFVTQKNIRETGLTLADTKFITKEDHDKFYKRSNVAYGDIIISMIGANRGMSCIVDDRRVFSIKNVGLIKKTETINQNYLLYFLKSPIAKEYVAESSNGGAQEFVGLTALRNFPVLVAPRKKQNEIVSNLDALSIETKKLETTYQQKLNDLEELKKSILQKAFTGELTAATKNLVA